MPPILSPSPRHSATNRITQVMSHIPWYCFKGQARLALDAHISKSALFRIIAGTSLPSYCVAQSLTNALERRLGQRLDIREIFSLDGNYPTASVCNLCGCSGCLPEAAWRSDDTLQESFKAVKSGQWSTEEILEVQGKEVL